MNKNISIVIGIILISIFCVALYFFIVSNNSDDTNIQKDKLQDSLNKAEKKLNKEKDNLNNLTQKLQDSFPLAVNVQGQMKKSFEVVQETDFMFYNPYSSNPELIIKDFLNSAALNSQRKEINILLARWQKEIDLLSIQKIDIQESEKIKKDIETIREFVKNLSEAVKTLTPENSGLSQSQIDQYSYSFYAISNIDEILISIDNSIKESKINPSYSNNNSDNNNTTNSNSDSSSIQIPFISDFFTDSFKPEDVVNAQEKVAEAQKEVDELKSQLSQLEQSATTITPIPEILPTVPIDENSSNTGIQRIKYEGIMIQPGPPRLIQGSDPY